MDSQYKLLPYNSTPFERDLLKTGAFDSVLSPASDILEDFKRADVPTSVLPWLEFEYGVGRLRPYISDLWTRITEGVAFNRTIGTPAALQSILGWMGLAGTLVEETASTIHFPEYQILLTSPGFLDAQTICLLWKGLKIAQPARSRFRRLFNNVWNVQPFKLDGGQWGDLLSDYSGNNFDDEHCCNTQTNLRVSLGRVFFNAHDDLSSDPSIDFTLIRERLLGGALLRADWPYLDEEFYRCFYAPDISVLGGLVRVEVESDYSIVTDTGDYLTDNFGTVIIYA